MNHQAAIPWFAALAGAALGFCGGCERAPARTAAAPQSHGNGNSMSSAKDKPDLLATAADDRLDSAARCTALIEYFRGRAGEAPLALGGPELLGEPRLARWFTADRLTDMTSGSRMPVDRSLGKAVVLFMPHMPPGDLSSVYLLLSEPVTIAQVAGWAADPGSCPKSIQVIQIGFGQSTPAPNAPARGTP